MTNIEFPYKEIQMSTIQGNIPHSQKYKLYAVINHTGNYNGGHYTACCRNTINKKWICYNDSVATEVEKKSVTKNAYILFYRRIDEHKSANIEVSSTNAESGSEKIIRMK